MCSTLLPKSTESHQVFFHILRKHEQEQFSFSISHTAWPQNQKLFCCASPRPVLRVVTGPKTEILTVKNHTVGTEEGRTNGRVRGVHRSPEITLPALFGRKNLLYLICCPSASAALPAQGEGLTRHEKQRRQQMLSAPRKCCHSNSTCIFLQLWKAKIFAFLKD